MRKIKILENFFALDYILLGKNINKLKFREDCDVCNQALIAEYLANKATLLSILYEMYILVDYKPRYRGLVLENDLRRIARESAHTAIEGAKIAINDSKKKEKIKEILIENVKSSTPIDEMEVIKRECYSIAIDNLLRSNLTRGKSGEWEALNEVYDSLKHLLISSTLTIQKNLK